MLVFSMSIFYLCAIFDRLVVVGGELPKSSSTTPFNEGSAAVNGPSVGMILFQ